MQLNAGETGKRYKVQDMSLALEIERRMEVVTVMNKKRRGAVIIKVRGTRFAIGRNIAENIQVKEEPDHE